jgi:hypothetical protein
VKRWCVEYTPDGEVTKVYASAQTFLGDRPTTMRRGDNQYYCDAIDELGAMARFIEAWRKKEQANA